MAHCSVHTSRGGIGLLTNELQQTTAKWSFNQSEMSWWGIGIEEGDSTRFFEVKNGRKGHCVCGEQGKRIAFYLSEIEMPQ